eukprot:GEZU01038926.1.p1 GENE.GEZU01038926.1~~GEZU01038926.1.p1  ORF type:complete len:251 (-),score=39.40 GEZU01038926.1:276-1028(-)
MDNRIKAIPLDFSCLPYFEPSTAQPIASAPYGPRIPDFDAPLPLHFPDVGAAVLMALLEDQTVQPEFSVKMPTFLAISEKNTDRVHRITISQGSPRPTPVNPPQILIPAEQQVTTWPYLEGSKSPKPHKKVSQHRNLSRQQQEQQQHKFHQLYVSEQQQHAAPPSILVSSRGREAPSPSKILQARAPSPPPTPSNSPSSEQSKHRGLKLVGTGIKRKNEHYKKPYDSRVMIWEFGKKTSSQHPSRNGRNQ